MKNEIRCPQCGTTIQIDEATYDSILDQVKKEAIDEAVATRSKEIEARYTAAVETVKAATRAEMMSMVNDVHAEYRQLQEKHQQLLTQSARKVQDEERRIFELQKELSVVNSRKESAIEAAVASEREKGIVKDARIVQLQNALTAKEQELEARSQNIFLTAQNKINELNNEIKNLKSSHAMELNAQHEAYKMAMEAKDNEIAHYRDFRARQSVKLLGESLEEHCRVEYENIRPLLPYATFEKDNLVSETGSKGDFIFRETDPTSGSQVLSIMFEMKTEEESSKNKHRNDDFLKELDKDRLEKGCEYAILVSTLEPENDYYNRGIVDVSHKYPKMLVIRPQFFLPLLMLLRSVTDDKVALHKKIEDLENQQLSALSLEHDLCDFKNSILKCHSLAASNSEKAVKRIDSAIKLLESIKDDLMKMEKHMSSAKSKAEDVTIQKLAKEHPAMFANIDTTTMDSAPVILESVVDPSGSSDSPLQSEGPQLKQPA